MPKQAKNKIVQHVVSLILEKDNLILLLRKPQRKGGDYGLIGGRVDAGESVLDALIREAYEEAAIQLLSQNLRLVHTIHRCRNNADIFHFFFYATEWQGELRNREPSKAQYLKWFAYDKMPEKIAPPILQGILGYRNDVPYSEMGWKKTPRHRGNYAQNLLGLNE